MQIDLDADGCKEVVSILTGEIGRLDFAIALIRNDTDPGKYKRWTMERARLVALRNKFVPGMKTVNVTVD